MFAPEKSTQVVAMRSQNRSETARPVNASHFSMLFPRGCLYIQSSEKFLVVEAVRLWETRRGFSKGCGKAAEPAFHSPSES